MSEFIRIDGLEKLQAKLKKNCTLDDFKKVVKFRGAKLQERAKYYAPVRHGWLRDNINLDLTNGGYTAVIESHADYGAYVEYGTRYMGSRPYMRPAFFEQSKDFMSDVRKLCI